MGLAATSTSAWTDVADGADLVLEVGPQGGFHMWLHLRASGLCLDGLQATPEAKTTAAELVASRADVPLSLVDLAEPSGWSGTAMPERLILCQPPFGIDVIDQPIDISVRVQDQLGRTATDSRRLVVRCPTSNQSVLATCKFVCDNDP